MTRFGGLHSFIVTRYLWEAGVVYQSVRNQKPRSSQGSEKEHPEKE